MSEPSRERVQAALAPHLGGARIVAMRAETIGTGQMSESRRLHLEYDGATGPATIVAKFPSLDPTSRATGRAVRGYEIEARFYRDLRPHLGTEAPRCWHAWRDEETDDFLLLLEDLAPCRQGDQLTGCTLAEAEAAVDALAGLHAPLWGSPELAATTWLARSAPEERGRTQALLARLWPGFLERYRERAGEEVARVGAALVDDPGDYFTAELPSRTLVHGDYRPAHCCPARRRQRRAATRRPSGPRAAGCSRRGSSTSRPCPTAVACRICRTSSAPAWCPRRAARTSPRSWPGGARRWPRVAWRPTATRSGTGTAATRSRASSCRSWHR
ncbi:MAG: hypothetical protein ACKORC_06800 [Acidimicrobiia bacterium]